MKERTLWSQLVLSAVSFFLCIALLVGSTFAWFSMQTENRNTIMAGSLSVKLTHTNKTKTNEDVGESTELFGIDYWEPGMMAYENFTITNNGDMALKYQFSLKDYAHNYITKGSDTTTQYI